MLTAVRNPSLAQHGDRGQQATSSTSNTQGPAIMQFKNLKGTSIVCVEPVSILNTAQSPVHKRILRPRLVRSRPHVNLRVISQALNPDLDGSP
jgi:hypothetical protein